MKATAAFLFGAMLLSAGNALCQGASPSATEIKRASSAPPRLGVFYYDHSRSTSATAFEVGGLTLGVIDYFIHSTPELKKSSIVERDRLAPLLDLTESDALLMQVLTQSDGTTVNPSVRYGMSQDMSAFMVIAELRSSSNRKMQPITLIYQSNGHEIFAKTANEIEMAVAEVERRKTQMTAREYRKKLESARSIQRDWPEIYRAHAHYWEDNEGARLRAELEQAVGELVVMANFVFKNSPDLSGVELEARIKEVLAQEGSHRLRVERSNLLVAKNVNDPDYFSQWNTFLD